MKPPPVAYRHALCIEEAVDALAEHGDEAKLIAGGQSLVPMLSLRLARPEVLIDIGRVPGARYLEQEGGTLRVGALLRHEQLERYPVTLPGFDVLRRAAPLVGHQPIRARGTFGGSIAHADGAAEWCMLAVALDASIRAISVRGTVDHPADGFFQGLFTTRLAPDEMIVEVRFPRPRSCAALREFSRRHGDFASAAAVVVFDLEDGVIADARVVLGGIAGQPVRSTEAEQVLDGAAPTPEVFREAGEVAAASISPPSDIHASAEVRRRLVATLVARAGVEATDTCEEAVHV